MDREAIIQYERKLKKEIEDKKVFDAIAVLQNCDDFELRKKYKNNLIKTLCSHGYHIESLPENPIDISIKMLIRADLDACIQKISLNDLSSDYAEYLLNLPNNEDDEKEFVDDDYKNIMQTSEGWNIANQFTSFQKISKHLIKKLCAKQISPDVVKKMNVMDCMHFVYQNCKSAFREHSLKKKFVQTFIRHNEEELRKLHYLQGVDVRYTNEMVRAMKEDGIACGIKICDENGRLIKGPEYQIHHRIPVKHSGDVQYFSEVNMFKNLVLVEKNIYHKLIHICETSETVANKKYFSKLLPPQNSVLISGLEQKDIIYYDFPNKNKIINPILAAVSLPKQKNISCVARNAETLKTPAFKSPKMPYKNGRGRRG